MNNHWCFICAKPQPCAHTKLPQSKPPSRETAAHSGRSVWANWYGPETRDMQIIVYVREFQKGNFDERHHQ